MKGIFYMNALTSVINIDAVKRMFKYGHQLLETLDLDPVYVVYWEAFKKGILSRDQLNQCIWWYCYVYDTGSVCEIIESNDQYKYVKERIVEVKKKGGRKFWGNDRAKPGGSGGIKAIEGIQRLFPKSDQIINTLSGCCMSCQDIFQIIGDNRSPSKFNSVNEWTVWKFSDMIERLDFKSGLLFNDDDMYEEPKKVVENLFGSFSKAIEYMTEEFGECLAPPRYERKCNLQEFETIWCKCKGEKLEDRNKIRKELSDKGELAKSLLSFVPK
ncbi:hypothetical protein C4577_04180 [Candidatus Parcubacteria bacterium]|nr:MAG: hypothetical protein C4577_04180 [Candidatus Parcubacteria bacterium]